MPIGPVRLQLIYSNLQVPEAIGNITASQLPMGVL